MPNFLYYDANGQKQGPINDEQLRTLAARGVITPDTPLETDSGYKGVAGQIPGLNFSNAQSTVRVAPVRNKTQSQAKFSMDKWLLSWLRDFSFQDIRLPVINLWVCRIVYAICCVLLALAILLGTPFMLFIAVTSDAPHDAPIAIANLIVLWICGPLGIVLLRVVLEWYIIMFDWIVETTKAARIYIENNRN